MQALAKYEWLTSCVGIELLILPDNSISCRSCTIDLEKDSLTITEKTEFHGDLEAVLNKVPKDKPIALTITGKGVLTKKAAKDAEIGSGKLLHLYPNLKPDDFHIQNFVSGESSFISIIRKTLVDDILGSFKVADLDLLIINIGPFAASHILKQTNLYGQDICFDGHLITLAENEIWEDYKYQSGKTAKFPIKIGIEPLNEKFLLAYSATFQLALYHRLDPISLSVDIVQNALEDFGEKQKFNFRIKMVLGSFFVLLLINFSLFSYYNSKNEVLLAEVNESSASVDNLQEIESDIVDKEKLLKEIGWNKGVSYAWLADQLGQTVPTTVKLKELSLNPPVTAESTRQQKDVYHIGVIKASGISKDLNSVNDWIYLLKSKSWVKQVRLDGFSPSSDGSDQQFSFSILLK